MLTQSDKKKILYLKKNYSVYAPLADKDLFQKITNALSEPFRNLNVDKITGIEARGFILGAAVAYKLGCGFVVIRKSGQMYKDVYSPNDVLQERCIDYSRKTKYLELEKHEKAIQKGDRVIIIDDWFEKGGQGQAAIKLIEKAGGKVVGIGVMLDQMTPAIRSKFNAYNLHALITFSND